MLFDTLPQFPPALPDAELRLLADLPEPGTFQFIECDEWATARKLARRGLVKISICEGELWASKMPTATLRQAH